MGDTAWILFLREGRRRETKKILCTMEAAALGVSSLMGGGWAFTPETQTWVHQIPGEGNRSSLKQMPSEHSLCGISELNVCYSGWGGNLGKEQNQLIAEKLFLLRLPLESFHVS